MLRSFIFAIITTVVVGLAVVAPRAYALCNLPTTDGIQLHVTSSLQQTVASASVGFTANIQNSGISSYENAALAIEVRTASTSQIVDRFIQTGISVAAGASTSTTFVWHTSGTLASGAYIVNVIFIPSGVGYGDAFSDPRLPRTSSTLSVVSGAQPSVVFSGPPTSPAPGEISLGITNTAKAPYRGMITWRVWKTGVGILAEPVTQETNEVEMLPSDSATVHYVLPHGESGVYYVQATLTTSDQVQAIRGAWMVKNALSQTNTNCDSDRSSVSDTLRSVGVVILLIVVCVLGLGYLRKVRYGRK